MKTIKKMLLFFCVIFSITTLSSSIIQLIMGEVMDSNFHIIDRGILVLIGVITITLFEKVKFKNKILTYLVSYGISMPIVFFYVWLSSFWENLHPNAYRDIFLNFTLVSIIVYIIIIVKNNIKNKKTA